MNYRVYTKHTFIFAILATLLVSCSTIQTRQNSTAGAPQRRGVSFDSSATNSRSQNCGLSGTFIERVQDCAVTLTGKLFVQNPTSTESDWVITSIRRSSSLSDAHLWMNPRGEMGVISTLMADTSIDPRQKCEEVKNELDLQAETNVIRKQYFRVLARQTVNPFIHQQEDVPFWALEGESAVILLDPRTETFMAHHSGPVRLLCEIRIL